MDDSCSHSIQDSYIEYPNVSYLTSLPYLLTYHDHNDMISYRSYSETERSAFKFGLVLQTDEQGQSYHH